MITKLEDYCLMCELGTPEYRAIFRDGCELVGKWGTTNGQEWVRDICHDCRGEMELQADKGEIWDLTLQRRFANNKFHYTPNVKG